MKGIGIDQSATMTTIRSGRCLSCDVALCYVVVGNNSGGSKGVDDEEPSLYCEDCAVAMRFRGTAVFVD